MAGFAAGSTRGPDALVDTDPGCLRAGTRGIRRSTYANRSASTMARVDEWAVRDRSVLLYLIVAPPLFALGITLPWWAHRAFALWLGLVHPDWEDRVSARPHTPSSDCSLSFVPPQGIRPRHLQLVTGGQGDDRDRVA